jgi:hypothetical protein
MIPMTFSMLLTVHGPSNLTCSEHNFRNKKGTVAREQLWIEPGRLARIIEGKIRRKKDPMVEQVREALKLSS